jgi:exosortase sorting signal-containing protein
MLLGHHRGGSAPSNGTRRSLKRWAAAAALLLLAAGSAQVGAGIIELGRKGQSSTSSTYRVTVDNRSFDDTPHSAGLAETILGRIVANINLDGHYLATVISDPNDLGRNLATVVRTPGGSEVGDLSVLEDDKTIIGASVEVSRPNGGGAAFRWNGVDQVNASLSETVTLSVTLRTAGLISHTINTLGKTPSQVNDAMILALTADGFKVSGSGPYTVVKAGDQIVKVFFTHSANAGVFVSSAAIQMGGPPDSIPTLSQWGMIVLVGLMGLAAVLVLWRKRTATAS